MDRREFFESMAAVPVLGLIFSRKRAGANRDKSCAHVADYENAIEAVLAGQRVKYIVARHEDAWRAQRAIVALMEGRGVKLMRPFGAIYPWDMHNKPDAPVITIRAAVGDKCHHVECQNHHMIILDSSVASLSREETQENPNV